MPWRHIGKEMYHNEGRLKASGLSLRNLLTWTEWVHTKERLPRWTATMRCAFLFSRFVRYTLPSNLESSHEVKGHVLKPFFLSAFNPFWWIFFIVLTIEAVFQSLLCTAAPSCAALTITHVNCQSLLCLMWQILLWQQCCGQPWGKSGEGWCLCGKICLLGLWWVNLQELPSLLQKLRSFISPTHPEQVGFLFAFSFLIAIPRKLAPSGFSTCSQCGFTLSLL